MWCIVQQHFQLNQTKHKFCTGEKKKQSFVLIWSEKANEWTLTHIMWVTLHKRWWDRKVGGRGKNKSIHCARIVGHYLSIATNTCREWQKLLLKIIYDWCAIIYVHLCNLTVNPPPLPSFHPLHSFVYDYYLTYTVAQWHHRISNGINRCGTEKSNGLRCGGMHAIATA